MLLKLYIYGYLNRVQSSLRLEREAGRNVDVIWLLVFPFGAPDGRGTISLAVHRLRAPAGPGAPDCWRKNPYRWGWRPPGWGRFQLTGASDPTPDRID